MPIRTIAAFLLPAVLVLPISALATGGGVHPDAAQAMAAPSDHHGHRHHHRHHHHGHHGRHHMQAATDDPGHGNNGTHP